MLRKPSIAPHRWAVGPLGTRCYGHLDFLDKAKDALAKVNVRELFSVNRWKVDAFLKPNIGTAHDFVQTCGLYIYMCVYMCVCVRIDIHICMYVWLCIDMYCITVYIIYRMQMIVNSFFQGDFNLDLPGPPWQNPGVGSMWWSGAHRRNLPAFSAQGAEWWMLVKAGEILWNLEKHEGVEWSLIHCRYYIHHKY